MSNEHSDRELIELAAKAAGIRLEWVPLSDGGAHVQHGTNRCWSPLTDDGDALRLAMKLHIQLAPDEWNNMATAFVVDEDCNPREETICVERWANDRCAATRRAIVRAAAAIGGAHE